MNSIHILHLEDSADDASLVSYWLSREGLSVDIKVVATLEEYVLALEKNVFDLVLADGNVLGIEAESLSPSFARKPRRLVLYAFQAQRIQMK